jgi:hypothetical protein
LDGTAVENVAEKPHRGKVAPVAADGSYSTEVSILVRRMAAGTTSDPATNAELTVTESPAVQSVVHELAVYVIFKGLDDTSQERDVSVSCATVLEVNAIQSQETLT